MCNVNNEMCIFIGGLRMTSVLIDYIRMHVLVDCSCIYREVAFCSLTWQCHTSLDHCLRICITLLWFSYVAVFFLSFLAYRQKGSASILINNNAPMSLDHCTRLPSVLLCSDALCFLLIIACIDTSLFLTSMSHWSTCSYPSWCPCNNIYLCFRLNFSDTRNCLYWCMH